MCGKDLRPHEDRRDYRKFWKALHALLPILLTEWRARKIPVYNLSAMKLLFTSHTAGWCNKFLSPNKQVLSCCWFIVMEVTFKTLLYSNNKIHLSTQQHLKTSWKNSHFYEQIGNVLGMSYNQWEHNLNINILNHKSVSLQYMAGFRNIWRIWLGWSWFFS